MSVLEDSVRIRLPKSLAGRYTIHAMHYAEWLIARVPVEVTFIAKSSMMERKPRRTRTTNMLIALPGRNLVWANTVPSYRILERTRDYTEAQVVVPVGTIFVDVWKYSDGSGTDRVARVVQGGDTAQMEKTLAHAEAFSRKAEHGWETVVKIPEGVPYVPAQTIVFDS